MLITSFVDAFLVKIDVIGRKRLVGWFFMERGGGGVKKILFLSSSSSLFGYLFTTCFFLNLIRIQNTRLGRQVFYQIHVYRLPYIMTMIDHLEMDFSSNDLEFLMKQSLKHII